MRSSGASLGQTDAVMGGFILGVPVERVVIATVTDMKEDADGGEKGERFAEGGIRRRCTPQQGEPLDDVSVAQATGGVLEVGFQVKERVAEAGMAGAGELCGGGGQGFALAGGPFAMDAGLQGGVEGIVAGEEAKIQQRQAAFRIGGLEALAVAQRPAGRRSPQTEVPQCLGEAADGCGGFGGGRLLRADEDVDVGEGKELLPTVAADSRQADPPG